MIELEFKKQLAALNKDLSSFLARNQAGYLSTIGENPHITRLIEAFSFLHAKVHSALEEAQAKLTCELVDFIYPHLNRHIPSFLLVRFQLSQDQSRPIALKRGITIEMEHKGMQAMFKLGYATETLPAEVVSARDFRVEEEDSPFVGSKCAVQIRLKARGKFSQIELKRLRFFINGSRSITYAVYNSIFGACCGIVIRDAKNAAAKLNLTSKAIGRLGFDVDQSLLPTDDNVFPGYQLLTEFFCFTEKFLFFDVLLDEVQLSGFGEEIIVELHFNSLDCLGLISQNTFLINVAPIINLFDSKTDPVEISPQKAEYQMLVNKKAPEECAIYSICEVLVGFPDQEVAAKQFSRPDLSEGEILWHSSQMHCADLEDLSKITLISKHQHPLAKYLYAKVKCFNGEIPCQAFSSAYEQIKMSFTDDTILVSKIIPVFGPSPVRQLCSDIDKKAQLLAFLSQHYLNLLEDKNAKRMLKAILAMYQFEGCAVNELLLNSIISVESKGKVDKVRLASGYQFCKGFMIRVNFSLQDKVPIGLLRLFCHVLDTFFAFYCPINSFIQFEGLIEERSLYLGKIRTSKVC